SAGSALAVSVPSGVVAVVACGRGHTGWPREWGSDVWSSDLSGSAGSWSGSPAPSFAYQWLRCDGSGLSCVLVVGATGSSYTLVEVGGGQVWALVTWRSRMASSAREVSVPTGVVAAAASAPVN